MFLKPCSPSFSSHVQKLLFPTSLVQVNWLDGSAQPGLNGMSLEAVAGDVLST